MLSGKVVVRFCATALFLLGMLFSWWPLVFLSPFVAMFYGYWVLALTLAWCADLLFGAPVGAFHLLVFPCTALIILSILARNVIIRHLR